MANIWRRQPGARKFLRSNFYINTASKPVLSGFWEYVPPVGGGSTVKVWTGATWTEKPVKRYNGASWVDATVKRYNGASWVAI